MIWSGKGNVWSGGWELNEIFATVERGDSHQLYEPIDIKYWETQHMSVLKPRCRDTMQSSLFRSQYRSVKPKLTR